MWVLLILYAGMLFYFFMEKRLNDRCLSSFTAVIHVNGIRGKTSTCRLLDGALRQKYACFTKTTGTDARIIHTDGTETPVRRLGPANIHEQLRMIRQARKEGAQILILECMAVNPVLQKAAQGQIVKSSITVITNVRYDHVFEMGDSLQEIAASLASTVPEGGSLYLGDPEFSEFFQEACRKKGSRLILCPGDAVGEENLSLARAVSQSLGVTAQEFSESLGQVREDFGAKKLYPVRNGSGETFCFLNLFSANDPMSTAAHVREAAASYPRLAFLYNHRTDRPDRALLFARRFFPLWPDIPVYITGKGAALPKRLFSSWGSRDIRVIRHYRECLDQPEGSLLVGIGNIKGNGYQLILELEGQPEDKR